MDPGVAAAAAATTPSTTAAKDHPTANGMRSALAAITAALVMNNTDPIPYNKRKVGDGPGRRPRPQFVQAAAAPNWRARQLRQINPASYPRYPNATQNARRPGDAR